MSQDDEYQDDEYLEMEAAQHLMRRRKYQEALPKLLRLRQRRVQRYWRRPRRNLGRICSICPCDLVDDTTDEITVGNKEGYITAINIEKEELPWPQTPSLGKAIKAIQAGTKEFGRYDSLFVCTGDEHVYVLNEKGHIEEKRGLVFPDEHIVSLSIIREGKPPKVKMTEVLIASEEKHIYIYDADLQKRLALFDTADVVSVLCSYDLTDDDATEIIAGTLDGSVYAYKRQDDTAIELWHYKTGGRIHALIAQDIDGDGDVEVVLGSEDGNVSILNKEGRLKWRYYAPSPVLAVHTSDIDQDEKIEVLIGTGSGRMLVLTAEGDLRWIYQASGPITGIHSIRKNLDPTASVDMDEMDTDKIEKLIAVSTSTQLELLQVIDTRTLQNELDLCIKKIRGFEDPKTPILDLTKNTDEYIRAYALMLLAGFHKHTDEDFELLHKALNDSSLEVRKGSGANIINLGRNIEKDDVQGKQELARLVKEATTSPHQEIRLSLATLIPMLVDVDAELCLSSLEKFMADPDLWVRHAAVRHLDELVGSHPAQTFPLLRQAVIGNDEWMSLEGCRGLAHYFDISGDDLADEVHNFLRTSIKPSMIQQIANNAEKPLVRAFFNHLAVLLSDDPALGVDLNERDRLFQHILQARMLADIIKNQYIKAVLQSLSVQTMNNKHLKSMIEMLRSLQDDDSPGKLNEATTRLEGLIEEIQAESLRKQKGDVPAQSVLQALVLQRLYDHIKVALRSFRGQAKIVPVFSSRAIQEGKHEIFIRISNQGDRKATDVRVILKLANHDEFEIVGSNEQFFETISTDLPLSASFTITLKKMDIDTLLLLFVIIYDDIGSPNCRIFFNYKISSRSVFQQIDNPYNSGQPVRNKAMFFDREEIKQKLSDLLLDPQRNDIALLYGQRKSGKTSLIYQLVDEIAKSQTHLPVFLDVQTLPFSVTTNKGSSNSPYNVSDILSDMLASFASDILSALSAFKKQEITVSVIAQDFQQEPLITFESFLKQITDILGERKLILCIDEFDVLEQVVKDNAERSNRDAIFVQLTRSLITSMKRVEGVRFLLAGDPQMRKWSALKDVTIAYPLSELELEDAKKLITDPIKPPLLVYERHALERILRLTNNQPYLIQLLCKTIVDHCNKEGIDYVDDRHVAYAVDVILDGDTNYLTWTWKYLLSKQEHLVLSFVAQDQEADDKSVSIRDIAYGLVEFERTELFVLLDSLQEKGILKKNDTGGLPRFNIAADLMREWLRRTKPLDVLRKEWLRRTKPLD